MDLFNAFVVLFFELCILLEVAGGALSSNLKQQLSNCYAGRLAQRNMACYWRGLRPHYLSQSYYYLCVVPGLPPVLCHCPYNLVFEESVQTCVPGYIKGANAAALLHAYRTKWANRYHNEHRHVVNNGAAHHGDPYENHVAVRPWTESRKRYKRATENDDPQKNSENTRHHRDPSHRLARNNDRHEMLQLHQVSQQDRKTSFQDENDLDFNTVSDFQGSEPLRNQGDEEGSIAKPELRSEKHIGPQEPELKHDMFPVWGIALASLCFVILLMLIVLYMY